ncbi:NEDD8 ultimate buster 1-like isoform X2 [Hypanus sabinus]|uniref:NEDD8 ultimate buster 1-like isoform X2 n=1 Tax=Hypanus sabinus TaxID=79690 RepID=UPI0028C401D5|nr:NEDD8 ultimate buster 1-like isoform X2 [Hypanus sabinus]
MLVDLNIWQGTDANNMMDCTENGDTSSGDLQLRIKLPNHLQGKEKKMKMKISRDATGAELCTEIEKNLQNTKAENMELTYKGKKLNLDKTLGEQGVKNKEVFRLTLINNEKRKRVAFLSRIIKGAELLAKRDKDFEGTYFNATNHRREIVNLPESRRAVFLTALILHEVGRWYMKKSDYEQALWFLNQAETEFRQCNEELLNSVDNYGVLNLDITWCYLQLDGIQLHTEAGERLEGAQAYFNKCFGENQHRLQEQEDKSGRHRILKLRLLVLWGVWFFYAKKLPQSRRDFGEAEELLDQLLVDDLSVSTLVNEGYSAREARLALRAMDGKIEEAKAYIEEKRQEQRTAEMRRQGLHGPGDTDNSEHGSPERDGSPDQINQEPTISANSVPVAGSSLSPPADGTSASAPTASAPAGAQSSDAEDEILREILQYLPNDIDDYIDLSLEDEEAIVREYKTKILDSEQRGS